jgi:hypothetical protein
MKSRLAVPFCAHKSNKLASYNKIWGFVSSLDLPPYCAHLTQVVGYYRCPGNAIPRQSPHTVTPRHPWRRSFSLEPGRVSFTYMSQHTYVLAMRGYKAAKLQVTEALCTSRTTELARFVRAKKDSPTGVADSIPEFVMDRWPRTLRG